MNRHEQREKAMICTYQYLLVPRDLEELIENTFGDAKKADPYFIDVIAKAIQEEARYAGYIDEVLTDWTFERLGMMEKAILLDACAEFDLKQIEAAVIIDESVELAKKYCDPEAYKLINRVLDII